MTKIILLDIDGVLVQPGGYRAALRATVQRFIGDLRVDEDVLTDFEKRGISSEWDMSPLIVASFWDDLLARHLVGNLSDDVIIAAEQIQSHKASAPGELSIPEFDLVAGQYPAETAFRSGLFPHIPGGLRKNLLMESRNARMSATMRTFQHFTLGSKRFEETYQLSAEFEAGSCLLTKDNPNVSYEIRERLVNPSNRIAAFTARPSGLPNGAEGSSIGYAPEAELALELVGMQDIPVMAFGKLEFIAAQHGLNPATLLKPSPFQALAGVFAAWTGDELSALHATYDWHCAGALNGRFHELPKSFDLIVVEDTMGGIHSTRAAGLILQQAGFNVRVLPLGMTLGSSAKADAFQRNDVVCFTDWNDLVENFDFESL